MAATNSISGTIDGNSISGYVRQLTRQENVCNPGQHADLILDTKFPFTVSPGNAVVLNENGTKVLTGWVVGSSRNRPAYDWIVRIDDNMTRIINTFLEDTVTTLTIRTVSSLIAEILDQCGVTYSFTAEDANVPDGIEIGLRSAWDAIQELLAYASWYLRFDANGVAQIGRVTDGGVDHTFSSRMFFQRELGDETTRNVIKVYGSGGIGPKAAPIFAKVSRTLKDITPDRVAAVGNPMIESQAEAERVANYLLAELGWVTDIKTVEVPGDATVRVGDKGRIIHNADGFTYHGIDVITTVDSTIEVGGGYTTAVTLGERCPRIAGWSRYVPPIYAGTSGVGVYRSTDKGVTWSAVNSGLPAGDLYVRRMAFNPFDEGMAIINSSLYYYDGVSWDAVTLPTPTDEESGDPLAFGRLVAVDSAGIAGEFNVLTTNANSSGSDIQQSRTWVFNTDDAGENWSSVQLRDNSGSGGHIYGLDVSSRFGIPTVAASSGSIYGLLGGVLIAGNFTRVAAEDDGTCDDPYVISGSPQVRWDMGATHWEMLSSQVSGAEPNRTLILNMRITGMQGHVPVSGNNTYRMTFFCRKGLEMAHDTNQIRITGPQTGVDTIAVSAAFSFTTPNIDSVPFTRDVQLSFPESTLGSVFSGRMTIFREGNGPWVGPRYIRTGDPVCGGAAMFTDAEHYTYGLCGTIAYDFDT